MFAIRRSHDANLALLLYVLPFNKAGLRVRRFDRFLQLQTYGEVGDHLRRVHGLAEILIKKHSYFGQISTLA